MTDRIKAIVAALTHAGLAAQSFVDRVLDEVIADEPAAWPRLLSTLETASLLAPALAPVVGELKRVPADHIVEVLRSVRTLI